MLSTVPEVSEELFTFLDGTDLAAPFAEMALAEHLTKTFFSSSELESK